MSASSCCNIGTNRETVNTHTVASKHARIRGTVWRVGNRQSGRAAESAAQRQRLYAVPAPPTPEHSVPVLHVPDAKLHRHLLVLINVHLRTDILLFCWVLSIAEGQCSVQEPAGRRTLMKVTVSACLFERSAKMGEIILHGPHHAAVKYETIRLSPAPSTARSYSSARPHCSRTVGVAASRTHCQNRIGWLQEPQAFEARVQLC
jgi:hypothetical protein